MLSQSENSKNNFETDFQASILAMTKQAAHDIRSPVTALNALVSSLPEVSEEKRQFLREISIRINSIANDLLERTQHLNVSLDQNEVCCEKPTLTEMNPEDTIRRVMEEKKLEYGKRREIQFEYKANFKEVVCAINEMELSRVLSNLINNSVEALYGQGKIRVQSRIEREQFEITIKDNGQGIPSDVLEKLGRVPVSCGKRGMQSGYGVGVFHACKAIKAMGGQLLIESRLGQGTTVRIQFPIMKRAA